MWALRTLVSLLASLAIAAAIVAATTMWRVLHDPISLATSLGGLLVAIARRL